MVLLIWSSGSSLYLWFRLLASLRPIRARLKVVECDTKGSCCGDAKPVLCRFAMVPEFGAEQRVSSRRISFRPMGKY